MSLAEALKEVRALNCQLVEVTGGEPLAQREVFPFIRQLCEEGYEVLIETGGYVSTADVDPRAKIILDVKCPASGEAERNHWENLSRLRKRGLGVKRSLALREFALGIEGLERFVRKEPLRQVHECVFAVLAMESEPVDPRL